MNFLDLVYTLILIYKTKYIKLKLLIYRTPNIPHVIKTFKDEYNIMLTSEREQNEIGRYFQQIDNLITLHQRKLQQLIKIKKAMLEKMFIEEKSK